MKEKQGEKPIKNFLYIPSFDAGAAGSSYRKNWKFKDGTPYRFYDTAFPEKYQWKSFLFPAGHNYKKKDFIKQFEFPDDMLVFGDSGGYQIASGAMKWKPELKVEIFEWLEANSTIAMNLDIPPRMKLNGKTAECLEISRANFKYFYENQSGKTDFLNVVQGMTLDEYNHWYQSVKDFKFQGWAIGGAATIYRLLSGLAVLLNGKEHLDANNKWLHVLGLSKINDFLMLGQVQRSLNEVGSNMQMMTDSSSPSRATVFGTWYTDFDIKKGSMSGIHVPRHEDIPLGGHPYRYLPSICPEIDDIIFDTYDIPTLTKLDSHFYGAMVLHNFAVFQEAIDFCNQLTNGHKYVRNQLISKDMVIVLDSIDEMIKSDKPLDVFRKYEPMYKKLSGTISVNNNTKKANEFFQF